MNAYKEGHPIGRVTVDPSETGTGYPLACPLEPQDCTAHEPGGKCRASVYVAEIGRGGLRPVNVILFCYEDIAPPTLFGFQLQPPPETPSGTSDQPAPHT